jgi:hypothetical protein
VCTNSCVRLSNCNCTCCATTGVKGVISALEVDTNFYKGNYPESCLVRTQIRLPLLSCVSNLTFLRRSRVVVLLS